MTRYTGKSRLQYTLRCMICGANGGGLVALQEHVMLAHGYGQDELRANKVRREGRRLIYTMPDGRDWLEADEKYARIPKAVEQFLERNPHISVSQARQFILDQIKLYEEMPARGRTAPVEKWIMHRLGCSERRNVVTAIIWARRHPEK